MRLKSKAGPAIGHVGKPGGLWRDEPEAGVEQGRGREAASVIEMADRPESGRN